MARLPIQVCIVYPSDPVGTVPGGIETCIRGIVGCTPADIQFSMIGATTDRVRRPLRQWSDCVLGDGQLRFYPLISLGDATRQPRVPATLRLMAALAARRTPGPYDALQFHRIEPSLFFRNHGTPRVTFIHQNMADLMKPDSDIRWKHAPWLYYMAEDVLLPRFQAVYGVHSKAVAAYKIPIP